MIAAMMAVVAVLLLVLMAGRVIVSCNTRAHAWAESSDVVYAVWWCSEILLVSLLAVTVLVWSPPCTAASSGAQVRIPPASVGYRLAVERATAQEFGVSGSPARLAAQLHQESGWRADAASRFAHGLAQFTPDTAAWLPSVCPHIGAFDPWDPWQSIRAAACYDRWLYQRIRNAADECDRWAMVLSGYNGGLGWVHRDRALASAQGADPARWFGHTEHHTARANWARTENRTYVRRILLRLEPAYVAAGWAGMAVCTNLGETTL